MESFFYEVESSTFRRVENELTFDLCDECYEEIKKQISTNVHTVLSNNNNNKIRWLFNCTSCILFTWSLIYLSKNFRRM